jgi:ketosteroid isomerase-like protein
MSQQHPVLVVAVGMALAFGCARVGLSADSAEAVKRAKAVVKSHEGFVESADLDGVLSNAADDIVVLAPTALLAVGKAAVRSMYATIFQAGNMRFEHQYQGAVVIGELVVLHGVAKGTLTPAQGQAAVFANDFILTLRKGADGKYRFWRVAFGPAES